jgi:hypothetical protein
LEQPNVVPWEARWGKQTLGIGEYAWNNVHAHD